MVDEHFGGICHLIPVMQPPIAEFTVFSCSEGKTRIKAADGTKTFCRNGQIVRGKKLRVIGMAVVVSVHVIYK